MFYENEHWICDILISFCDIMIYMYIDIVQMFLISIYLKQWIAVARHNFK